MTAQLVDNGGLLPATILTGFLGSGKTTLLNRLLSHEGMANTAVIVNEFGEIGLDHLLVETPDESMVLMDSGCLCCTILGDLVQTLQTLLAKRMTGVVPAFERVVIETTGLADPAPILHTLIADPDVTAYYRLDSVVAVVDAVNADGQLDAHFESVKQLAVSDRIVISKTDLASEDAVSGLIARLQGINPGAAVFKAVMGQIDPDRLFGAEFSSGEGQAGSLAAWLDADARDDRHTQHHHDGIQTFAITREEPVEPAGLELWLDLLASYRGPNLLRVKGLLNVAGKPVVVHAVQHLFHPPLALDDWPDSDHRSRIVFITHGIGRADIDATLDALDFKPERPAGPGTLDPSDYARFVSLMKRFEEPSP
ncbi:MAG: GTP-binding protein [Alphaproteobacteria bacterium]|nr:GTP-binding protein [Alphaproteobacteria bacterium]